MHHFVHYLIRPSLEEIKHDALAKKGGLCYTINVFMKCLLEALGYNVYYIAAIVNGAVNHITIIVANVVTSGDCFLFDPGLGYPNFELIPLNFLTETEVYSHSFVRYKFIREGEYVVRCHKSTEENDDPIELPGVLENGWKKIMYIDLTPRELKYFDGIINKIYRDIDSQVTPFHNSVRIAGYKEHSLMAVIIKDSTLLIENGTSRLEEIKLNSTEEMLKHVEEHYPSLKDDVILSLKCLSLF